MSPSKYRLITRSDFDGLVCAVLLNELELIDDIKFVHPKDMQDGKIEVTARDITTNPKACATPANGRITSFRPMRRRRRAWCSTTTVAPRPSPTSPRR